MSDIMSEVLQTHILTISLLLPQRIKLNKTALMRGKIIIQ